MDFLLVEIGKRNNYLDVYVIDDILNLTKEKHLDISLGECYSLIENFRKKYNINAVDFVTYDNDREVSREHISL